MAHSHLALDRSNDITSLLRKRRKLAARSAFRILNHHHIATYNCAEWGTSLVRCAVLPAKFEQTLKFARHVLDSNPPYPELFVSNETYLVLHCSFLRVNRELLLIDLSHRSLIFPWAAHGTWRRIIKRLLLRAKLLLLEAAPMVRKPSRAFAKKPRGQIHLFSP